MTGFFPAGEGIVVTERRGESMKKARRVLVVGLDGMTKACLYPLVEKGIMPCVGKLIDEGVCGTLMSVTPPVTGPAWTSFFTGRNPGSHGILDFFKVSRDGRSRRLINSREVAGKTLWDLLNEQDRTQVIVNTPLTYPPTPVKGAMITGMLTPKVDSNMTWPDDLYRRLKPELGDYVITVNWQQYSKATAGKFIDDLLHCNAQRTKWVLKLMEENDWDFTMATFTGTDRVQHALWNYIDPERRSRLGKDFDQQVLDGIYSYYRQLDTNIGRIVEKAGPETTIYFVSDHGFGPLDGKVYVNNWLEGQGLLKIRHCKLRAYKAATFFMRHAGRIMHRLRPGRILGNLRPKAKQRAALASLAYYHVFYNSIDWSRTKAYMASNSEQGIYINLKGREPFGIVDPADYDAVCNEVEQALRALTDESGRPLLTRFYRRGDVYTGPYTDRAPDLIFFLDEGAHLAEIQMGGGTLFRDVDWRTGTGNHRMEGFFLAHGPGIAHGPGNCPSGDLTIGIIDVLPTILYTMGLPIPEDLDGSLIETIFTDAYLQENEPVYRGVSSGGGGGWDKGEDVFDRSEEADLQDRMRSLGYMD